MTDDLDHVLSSEPDIRPSRAFLTSVMNAVEREAAAPPPIPFPWLRAIPLVIVALALAVLVVVNARSLDISALSSSGAAADEWLRAVSARQVIWTLVGVLVSAASATAAMLRVER
jgi:hypothetical protein